jgi:predicted RNase H-like nuclease (RuvC/YqgF family)
MRDIRSDLKDRAEALDREIKAAQVRFDELLVRLKEEHDVRVEDLKSELDAVKLLIGLEHRRLGNNGTPISKPQPQPEAQRPQAQAQPPRPQQEQLRKAG